MGIKLDRAVNERTGMIRAEENEREGAVKSLRACSLGKESAVSKASQSRIMWAKARSSRNLNIASFLVLSPTSPFMLGDAATCLDTGLEQVWLQTMIRDHVLVCRVITFPAVCLI